VTPQQLRDLLIWVNQYAAALDAIDQETIATIVALYSGRNFYSVREAAELAEEAAETSATAALLAAGLAAQYLITVSSLMSGEDLPTPAVILPLLRNGTDMRRVFQRPLKMFRRLVAKGVSPADAYRQAMNLAALLTETNNSLAAREAFNQALDAIGDRIGVTGYRRIVHPELSKTGSCGLCIVASDQVYNRRELLPMHGRCKCTVLPIIGAAGGAGDPGSSLNRMALGDFYALAGNSNLGDDLKKVRVQVNEHGEYGPSLGYTGQKFTSWEDLGLTARNAA
jgi:hypothetical protein